MHSQGTAGAGEGQPSDLREVAGGVRDELRAATLQSALRKRQVGVPTYSVPEVAALLSVSPEHVYRLIKADVFPAVVMAVGGRQGRYVVPAAVVERLLGDVAAGTSLVDVGTWTASYRAERAGGAA
jgi:predicted DNA-binding transcriptional regulator AlpA